MVTKKKKPQKKPSSSSSWRRSRLADHAAIVSMSQALYVEDPGSKPMGARDIARTLRTFEREPVRGKAVVVVVDGVVCGYALLCSFWSNELHGEVCTIDELFIAPAHRSRGLGSKLVQGLAQRSLPVFRRAVAFELEVSPRNLRARALYERLGFVSRKNATLRLLTR
ncbi:MAG: GNAT family N-acetyltransferase [Deltaproteobacteria bacterium]|nr:GNAT family N-acetyltransferase [Deltaproteobacteria bacterium]